MAATSVVTKVVELRLVDAYSETDKMESGRWSSSLRVFAIVGRDMTREGVDPSTMGIEGRFQAKLTKHVYFWVSLNPTY
jgi:hypothetical protein